jgi:hypothetical protein
VNAGIHKIQIVIDSRLRGNDTSGTFYESINTARHTRSIMKIR